jgi:hypothetical protein
MGNSKKELESIKAKLLKSHPSEVNSLLRYLEDLLTASENSDPSPPLTLKQLKKIASDISGVP